MPPPLPHFLAPAAPFGIPCAESSGEAPTAQRASRLSPAAPPSAPAPAVISLCNGAILPCTGAIRTCAGVSAPAAVQSGRAPTQSRSAPTQSGRATAQSSPAPAHAGTRRSNPGLRRCNPGLQRRNQSVRRAIIIGCSAIRARAGSILTCYDAIGSCAGAIWRRTGTIRTGAAHCGPAGVARRALPPVDYRRACAIMGAASEPPVAG